LKEKGYSKNGNNVMTEKQKEDMKKN